MLSLVCIYQFISAVSISLLTPAMDGGKDLTNIFPFSLDGTGDQTELRICGIDVLCHNKPQYIVFIHVLQACHNNLAF